MSANIVSAIRARTSKVRNRSALRQSSRSITYDRLLGAAEELAESLRERGVAPYDRVGFVCDDGIDYVVASLALLAVPAAIVPLPPTLEGPEVETALERMDVAFLLDARPTSDAGEGVPSPPECEVPLRLVTRETHGTIPEEARALNPAFIRFSSGTTGTSKGVLLSHESILERTAAANEGLGITSDDTVVWVLSMSYHFVVSILLFLQNGATVVICEQPLVESMRAALEEHGGTVTYASPFHYQLAVVSGAFGRAAFENVRLPISTAMNLPVSTANRFHQKFGRSLAGAYGIIEVGLPFVDTDPDARRIGTVGRKLPAYEVKIESADAEGNGEILVRGPGMFDAYVAPWRLRDEALDDGWFRTGDVGHVDVDGYLEIVGRRKTVINFAGMKVFPYQVEEVLDAHEDVVESLVYGAPHSTYGELPSARIVLRADCDEATTEQSLLAWCRERLAPYKVPRAVEFVAALPRTASNKIARG